MSATSFRDGPDSSLVGRQREKNIFVCVYMKVSRFIDALEFTNHVGFLMSCKYQRKPAQGYHDLPGIISDEILSEASSSVYTSIQRLHSQMQR